MPIVNRPARMKVYRVHKLADAGTSFGFEHFLSKTEARAFADQWLRDNDEAAKTDEIEIAVDRQGIMRALALYASHPDNG